MSADNLETARVIVASHGPGGSMDNELVALIVDALAEKDAELEKCQRMHLPEATVAALRLQITALEKRIEDVTLERDKSDDKTERAEAQLAEATEWRDKYKGDLEVMSKWHSEEQVTAERAKAQLAEAKKALEPFAKEADQWEGYEDAEGLVEDWQGGPTTSITVGHLRKARRVYAGGEAAALSPAESEPEQEAVVASGDPLDEMEERVSAYLSAIPPSERAVTEATHRHKKRGTEYVLIGIGRMQAENWHEHDGRVEQDPSVDMREVAIYRSVDDGSLWVRPREEFEDGRFEALTAAMEAKR